ncbi:MAG: type 1 glutamine amidotransferase [Bacteroidota bacterium]
MKRKLKIHCLQHVPFEGLAQIQTWITKNGHRVSFTRFYENDDVPGLDTFDWLIIMGGPMGVNDNDLFPWLLKEKEIIRNSIENNKTVLGICLGAQLIASALGAKVYPNPVKEIGWFPVQNPVSFNSPDNIFSIHNPFHVFHWHGDTFDLPKRSQHLYESVGCSNQGFLFKEKVLGLQFHFEVNHESVQSMVKHGMNEIMEVGRYIQSADSILEDHRHFSSSHQYLYKLLDYLAE